MTADSLAVLNIGLVTSVGLSAPASCAAIRGAITNHTRTRFMGASGEWLSAAQVALESPYRGTLKLVKMLSLAVEECLTPRPELDVSQVPLLLCLAEADRPGRLRGIDTQLLPAVQRELNRAFHAQLSGVLPHGRVAVAMALAEARTILLRRDAPFVVIAATDSLLVAATLASFQTEGRLLTSRNSNGFVPGEGAGAILVSLDSADRPTALLCVGMGFDEERATVASEEPLRADGLTRAITQALAAAGCEMHDLDARITDNSGERYYFKESALALSRTLRKRKEEFDIWHPADCVGEVGAVIGIAAIAVAAAATTKGYSPGPNLLFHSGNDQGRRAALIFRYRES